jgi:hypothetical protein
MQKGTEKADYSIAEALIIGNGQDRSGHGVVKRGEC